MSVTIGIVGATGAVGQELIKLLLDRMFPANHIQLFASSRSAGKTISVGQHSWEVVEAVPEAFENIDLAIFSAGGSTSLALAKEAVARNCIVIDNSSAFRMDADVPLVVPEVNPDAVDNHKGIVANPNCSTAVALMGLYPLHKEFGLKRFFASTYQAVSGSGAAAMIELENQVKSWSEKKPLECNVYPHPIAFNLIPHVDTFNENGYTREELKMLNESSKIMNLPNLKASTTCVRVPVFRSHSIAINAEFEKPVDIEVARKSIEAFPGCELVDMPEKNLYPMPLDFSEKEKCGVGRLRKDLALDNGLSFWVVGDQLWKGAALNAIQIFELMQKKGLI